MAQNPLSRWKRINHKIANLEAKILSKDDVIETEGVVVEAMPGATFKVQIAGGHIVTAYLSGKLWKNFIRVYEGDTVKLEISPYDLTRGRIIWRSK